MGELMGSRKRGGTLHATHTMRIIEKLRGALKDATEKNRFLLQELGKAGGTVRKLLEHGVAMNQTGLHITTLLGVQTECAKAVLATLEDLPDNGDDPQYTQTRERREAWATAVAEADTYIAAMRVKAELAKVAQGGPSPVHRVEDTPTVVSDEMSGDGGG